MKKIPSILIQIGAFAGLVLMVLVPMLIAENWLGLSKPWPMIIGLVFLIAVLGALFSWIIRYRRKENTVTKSSHHLVFGDVRHFKNRWECSVSGIQGFDKIDIGGDSDSPTADQVSTMLSVRDRLHEFVTRAIENANEGFGSEKFSLKREDVQIESIYLPATGIGSFDLDFAVPLYQKDLPWGFSATFIDFEIDEISDNH